MQSIYIPPTLFETFPRAVKTTVSRVAASTTTTSNSASTNILRQFRSSPPTNMSNDLRRDDYKIDTTSVPTATGVSLNPSQNVITGSILDLFVGRPSLRKLSLWNDTASFVDPLTIAEGRDQFAPQWYGLRVAFSNIERLGGRVTSSGNPIEMDLKTRYTLKAAGSQQTIESKVKIWTEGEGSGMRVKRVEDRWNDNLPTGTFKTAIRNLNSATVPKLVSVPKSIEEEENRQ